MKKTRMLLFVLLLFVSIFSSACSNAEQADVDSGDEQDSGEANEVRIVSLSNDEASFAEGFELMGNTLEEKYQINFDINNHADTTAYQSTLRTSLSTSQAPGFFKWWSGYRMEELVHDGLLADLTGTWDTLIDQGVNPDLANAFKFDDKMYGLPLTSNYWIIFYNMDVFKENGIDIPNSWDEFMQVNETLKENGIVPLAQSVDDRWPAFIWFEELMVRYDADLFVDLMEGRASYTDPSVIEVMEIWKSLYDHGYFSEPLNWQNTMASEFAVKKEWPL